ncbi:hypothetical protein V5799_010719 [Amblyomma americanum]|uniref:Lipase domain-containing protein n=1 Tax=Amblyomma americanum TaxID=6943 RepID=A0AAQ4EJG1_AMBAM
MYSESYLMPEHVHVIGFRLGAHAAGFCGRHFQNITGKKFGRTTGLEPAGLLFENTNVSLSKEDANFMDVIHTNGGDITDLKLGMLNATGHADFYPNGGEHQPGCPGGFSQISCSHNRAWWLFTSSLENRNCSFKSIPCSAGWYSFKECLKSPSLISVEWASTVTVINQMEPITSKPVPVRHTVFFTSHQVTQQRMSTTRLRPDPHAEIIFTDSHMVFRSLSHVDHV